MKLHKTKIKDRIKYTYYFENADKVILEPGKSTTFFAKGGVSVVTDENITDVTIKNLHSLDDSEVYGNLKYINFEDNEEKKKRIALKKAWAEKHPGEENPYDKPPRLARFDSALDDEAFGDKSKVQYDAVCVDSNEDVDDYKDQRQAVRALVSTFPKKMQELYKLLYIDALTQTEICKRLNLEKTTISLRKNKLDEKIYNYFQKNKTFD